LLRNTAIYDCETYYSDGLLEYGEVLEVTMKDLHEVLSQKQRDIERVRREIDTLLFVIPLLAEDADRIEPGLSSRSRSEWTGHNRTSLTTKLSKSHY
jgi:hypothetical protein